MSDVPDEPDESDVPGVREAHDALFRAVFGVPANAASLLRAALPAELTAGLDLGRLVPVPASFVNPRLGKLHADLVYKVRVARSRRIVYLLLEHQSSADARMVVRIFGYLAAMWTQHLRARPRGKTVPQAVAVVICHHSGPWPSPVRLADVMGPGPVATAAGGRYLPGLEYVLFDLAALGIDELAAMPLTAAARVTLLLMKITRGNPGLAADLHARRDWLAAELAEPGGREAFGLHLAYIGLVSHSMTDSDIHELADSLGRVAQEAYMTAADELMAKGRVKGRAEVLVRQLTRKFGPLSAADAAAVEQAVAAATAEEADAIADRVLTAASLDEAIGRPGTERRRRLTLAGPA